MVGRDTPRLHEFTRPPVIETILGVHFKPIRGLTTAHLGMFWHLLGKDQWPGLRELGAIVPQIERLDVSPTVPFRFMLREMQQPEVRLRFSDKDDSKIVQVQANLLQTHWIRTPGTDYPRYTASTKPEFLEIWSKFAAFVREEGFSGPEMLQWEVTYINRIPSGEDQLWRTPADWSSIFNGVLVPPPTPDGAIESARVSYHYRLADNKGRLHVEVYHKLGEDNEPDSLELKLTARGQIVTSPLTVETSAAPTIQQTIGTGLDTGRHAIVNGFAAFGAQKSLDFWGQKKDNSDE
jgi:uncharacterized protein (TIGR04255 family)